MEFVFYNPSKIIGGAEYLFYRLYVCMKKVGIECKIVDYKDGIFLSLGVAANDLITMDSIYDRLIIECDYFVLPPNFSYDALYSVVLNPNAKIIFWSLHPLNCVPSLPFPFYKRLSTNSNFRRLLDFIFLRKQKIFAKRLFGMASQAKSMFFMDFENYATASKFIGGDLKKIFLSIPAPDINLTLKERPAIIKNSNEYVFFWIGRLVDFKVGSLNRLILDLDQWCLLTGNKVTLFIVGDGKLSSSVLESHEVNIVKLGHVENGELHCLIKESANAVFGMGTSILESAALGVASFIVMPTYKSVGNILSYVPLPNTKNYNLGSFSDESDLLSFQQLEIESLLRDDAYSKACSNYVLINHGLDAVLKSLLHLSENSNLRYVDIEKDFREFFIARFLYSFVVRR